MHFNYYGRLPQRDSEAILQLTDQELLGALTALAAGQGYPPRGATAADLRESANLLLGEAIKRRLPLPAGLSGGQVINVGAADPGMVRAEQEKAVRSRLSSISVQDLVGILQAIDTNQPYYKDSRLESLAPFRDLFAAELGRRSAMLEQGVTALPAAGTTSSASTEAPSVEKSNTALILGGAAVIAALFLLKK
jgi:hypothetical protein